MTAGGHLVESFHALARYRNLLQDDRNNGRTIKPGKQGSACSELRREYNTLSEDESKLDRSDNKLGGILSVLSSDLASSDATGDLTISLTKAIASHSNLYGDTQYSRTFDFLLRMIVKLESEKQVLQSVHTEPTGSVPESQATSGPEVLGPVYEVFHMVLCDNYLYYRDVPRMFKDDSRFDHLRGRIEVENMGKYLDKHSATAFAVVHEYSCGKFRQSGHAGVGYKSGKLIEDTPPAEEEDTMHISMGQKVRSAIQTIIKAHPEQFKGFDPKKLPHYFRRPFLFFYIHNKNIAKLCDMCHLDTWARSAVRLLCEWFEDNYRADWDEADELLARGKVNSKHYSKLFRPNEILLRKSNNGLGDAIKTMEYPWEDKDDYVMDAFEWKFNGLFGKTEIKISLKMEGISDRTGGEMDITSLPIYPLRFAEDDVYERLKARGEKLWKCRTKSLVCYKEDKTESLGQPPRVSQFIWTGTTASVC
jgi:hypothetical protein